MAINSIYKYLKESKLKEELHVEGLPFIGNAYGFDLYRALTFEGAQALVVGNTQQRAGEGFVSNEQTFNSNINEQVRLYFFVRENTNNVILGVISGQEGSELTIENKHLNISTGTYQFQNVTGASTVVGNDIIPLFLLPNFTYNGHDGLIISDDEIIGNYQGLIGPANIPAQIELSDVDEIKENAFTNYPVQTVILGDNIQDIERNAFFGYRGTIRCFAESPEDEAAEGWSEGWNGDCNSIVWGINLSPEEVARREEEARLERERREREERERREREEREAREREERERRNREIQAAETLAVLKYKPVGNEITILGCKPGRERLEIPAEIDGKPVTTIAPFAFYENERLREVRLPATIKLIGKAAFYGCNNATIYYPRSATLYTDALKNVGSTRQQ